MSFNNIRYADDIALLTDSEATLQTMFIELVHESERRGLIVNTRKMERMVTSKRIPVPRIRANGDHMVRKVDKMKYLGSLVTDDAKCEGEIRRRIAFTKQTFRDIGSCPYPQEKE